MARSVTINDLMFANLSAESFIETNDPPTEAHRSIYRAAFALNLFDIDNNQRNRETIRDYINAADGIVAKPATEALLEIIDAAEKFETPFKFIIERMLYRSLVNSADSQAIPSVHSRIATAIDGQENAAKPTKESPVFPGVPLS